MRKAFTRRAFVAAAAAFGAFAPSLVFRLPWSDGAKARAADALAGELTSVFRHKRSAAAVGRAYLRQTPAEANRVRLVSLLCPSCEAPPPAGRDRRALQQWVQARQRRDFEEGRVVQVQGWILSETEARLCALSALT